MSHYDIDYTGRADVDPIGTRRAAVNDVARYLGSKKQLKLLFYGIRSGEVRDEKHLRFLCGMLLGIEGYPVGALWSYVMSTTDGEN